MSDGTPDAQRRRAELVRRLHCAEGHLRGVAAMAERGADCATLVHQILAVQAALREVNRLMVRRRVQECLSPAASDPVEQRLDEVLRLYQLTRA